MICIVYQRPGQQAERITDINPFARLVSAVRVSVAGEPDFVQSFDPPTESWNVQPFIKAVTKEGGAPEVDFAESEADFIERIAAKDVPAGLSFKIMDSDDPAFADRAAPDTFRDAWTFDGAAVAVDMPKARTIHMERLRTARDAALTRLDGETVKAVGKGDDAERDRVEARRQTLRDLPATIDLESAATPEELKAKWHADLDAKERRGD